MIRSRQLLLTLIIISAALILTAACLAALPSLVRAMPGRYAYYLPEPLQQWRQVDHPITLPTPVPTHTPSPTPSPTAFPTGQPSPFAPSPTPVPTQPPTAIPSPVPPSTPSDNLPISHTLTGLQHEYQQWNNCGPATLAMALSYWQRTETQEEIAPLLKPDPEDKNVSPEEIADAARSLGLQAMIRVGGSQELLKHLIAVGIPVIVETWYVQDGEDQMGHYRLLTGYDDAAQQFLTYDSLHGANVPISYQALDELWRVFNRVYLVITPPGLGIQVASILGLYVDETISTSYALEVARWEANRPPETCVAYVDCADAEAFAWFNIGSNLIALEQYEEAAAAYDRARILGLPWRMIWYQFGPYQAYYATGRYQEVAVLADATLNVADNLEESFYWRGLARQALGDLEGARSDFEAALRCHPEWGPALEALIGLGE